MNDLPIPQELLGRYEFHGQTDKGNPSHKFWHVVYSRTEDSYAVKWGSTVVRKNIKGEKMDYTESQLRKLIKSKIKKGYKKVDGDYDEVIGSNTAAFLMEC